MGIYGSVTVPQINSLRHEVKNLGLAQRRSDAQQAAGQQLDLKPDFILRGPDFIRRLTFLDEHVAMLLDGLREAGLEI